MSAPIAREVRLIDDIRFVYGPAGKYLMGSSNDDVNADSDEKPQHAVDLDVYWIMQTEVTNAQWRNFMNAGGYETKGRCSIQRRNVSGGWRQLVRGPSVCQLVE